MWYNFVLTKTILLSKKAAISSYPALIAKSHGVNFSLFSRNNGAPLKTSNSVQRLNPELAAQCNAVLPSLNFTLLRTRISNPRLGYLVLSSQIHLLPATGWQHCASPMQEQLHASRPALLRSVAAASRNLASGMQDGFVETVLFVGIAAQIVEKGSQKVFHTYRWKILRKLILQEMVRGILGDTH